MARRLPALAALLATGGILGFIGSALGSSGASALVLPSPTPCALPPPLTCALPTPLPSALPTPPTTASGSSGSGGTSGTSLGTVTTAGTTNTVHLAPTLSQSAATPLLSLADQALIQSELTDPALAGQLLAVLQNPVSTQPPDLFHFEPATARSHATGPTSLAAARPVADGLAIMAGLVAAVSLLGLAGRRRATLLIVAVALTGGSGLATTAAIAGVGPAPTASPRPVPDRMAALPRPRPLAASPWTELLAVEARLAVQHRRLVADEAEMVSLTESLTDAGTADTPLAAQQRAITTRLRLVLARHAAATPAYQAALEVEYQIYRSAAQRPDVAAQLRQGARRAGPEAVAAVQGDLDILATQLQQEAAIAAAQAQLQQLGLTAVQRRSLQSPDAFIAPVGGPIGQPFGPTAYALEPPLDYHGVFYPHFHTGIDIDAPLGTPVQAAMAGVVALVASSTDGHGHSTGYGNYVVIQHGHGYLTLYGHLSRVMVRAGQIVAQGQVIGLVGSTGNSTGPHLHFEIRRGGDFVDPLPYVTGALKPW